MFSPKYLWDAVIAIIVLLICVKTWESTSKKSTKVWTVVVSLLVGFVLIIAHQHWLFFSSSANTGGAGKAVKNLGAHFPWFRVILSLVIGVLTFWHAKRVAKPKSWLGDKRDNAALWATVGSGACLALSLLIGGGLWSLLMLFLALVSLVGIMHVQVREQELWTPTLFGRRCFGEWWMLGNYSFNNGFHWMLLPRNCPGLSFNVAKPRRGVSIKCKTAKVPTKGFSIGGVELVGGEVDVEFTLLFDSHDDLDAFYSSQEAIRTDPVKLAAYASDIYGAEFRELLKGKTLDEIQTGDVFRSQNFDTSRQLFEMGTGHHVTRCLVEDPTPSKEVQDQINALAAKRIEKVQAELEKDIALVKADAVGRARLAELQPLADALEQKNMLAAINAVRGLDMARFSNLRVMVDSQLRPLLPLVAEAAE